MSALAPPHGSAEPEPLLLKADELERERKRGETLATMRVTEKHGIGKAH
jgi:hypothetical protein